MSFDFGSNSINRPFKAQQSYKDASMGGGGMYFRQKKKDEDEDLFEKTKDDETEFSIFDSEPKKEDIPEDTFFNKLVNWFQIKKD